jgi:hypothetical protein
MYPVRTVRTAAFHPELRSRDVAVGNSRARPNTEKTESTQRRIVKDCRARNVRDANTCVILSSSYLQ